MRALEKEMFECKKPKRAVDHSVKQYGGLIHVGAKPEFGKKFQDGGQTSVQRAALRVLAMSREAAKRQFFLGLVPNTAYRRAFSTCSAHKLSNGVS